MKELPTLSDATQPPPTSGTGDMWLRLIEKNKNMPVAPGQEPLRDLMTREMEARREIGLDRYKHPVQTGNGRNFVIDLFQELMDALVYFEGWIAELEAIPSPDSATVTRLIAIGGMQAHLLLMAVTVREIEATKP